MPGPMSDSYHPEFSTGANADAITGALREVYHRVTDILGKRPPLYILDVVNLVDCTMAANATLTEREWRLIRFAIERAIDSI